MSEQIVITEKSSQAKDVRAAVGSRYGLVLAAEGHLLDLLEPEDFPDFNGMIVEMRRQSTRMTQIVEKGIEPRARVRHLLRDHRLIVLDQ